MATAEAHTGPHLVTAVLCEKVLQEQDGVLSVIRIIDRVIQSAAGPEVPDQMPPFISDNLTLLVALRADQARGRFGIKIRPEAPGGIQLPPVENSVTLQPGSAGVNLIMPMAFPISEEGVYWFDVFLTQPAASAAERLLTRVPLEVHYSPQKQPSSEANDQ